MSLNLKSETIWISLIFLSVAIAFSGSLRGNFVYDDRRQIVANPLIQNSALYGKAITSDVWAFKGDGTIAASNYWRPVFTAWCIINFLLFGLNPFGWHLANLLLHAAVCILAYLLLRRWEVSQKIALAIAIIFAVHPVHTESVAWISGSPDILLSLFLLLAILFADMAAVDSANRKRNIAIALVFYMLALGSKEIAVFCAPVFILLVRSRDRNTSHRGSSSWLAFFGAAAVYFVLRWVIIGRVTHPVPDSPDLLQALLTVPALLVFYLGQIVWPVTLGPNYPLRPVGDVGLSSFVIPLVISFAVIAAAVVVSRGSFLRRIGVALFILPLVPAFAITAFPSDQIVHDRYLYLPLLGFLILVVTSLCNVLEKRLDRRKSEMIVLGVTTAVAITLCVQTISYRRVWLNDISLWRHAVTVDENSASNWLQLGAELADLNAMESAAVAYQRSLAIRQDPLALMGNSRVAIARGDLDGAVRDLETVIATPAEKINAYTLFQSYETLAVAYQQQKNYAAAEQRLREGRERLPIYRAALTEKLAVILYVQNRKSEALSELESSRGQAKSEMLSDSKLVLFRLGMLYYELGRRDDARAAFTEYLMATANADAASEERARAAEIMKSLR